MKLRYWIDIGQKDEFDGAWFSDEHKEIIKVALVKEDDDLDNDTEWDAEDAEEVLSVCNRPDKPNLSSRPKSRKKVNKSKKKSDQSLFWVTIFKTTRNIIIQGSHHDYFAEKEYPWLRNLIDEEDILTSYNEATGEQIKPEELLADPENINNTEFINLDLGISTNSPTNIDPSTPVKTISLNIQQLKGINKPRVRQKKSLAAPVDVLKKAAKGKQSKKNDEDVTVSRLEHLEMLYSQMDNIIGNNFESIVYSYFECACHYTPNTLLPCCDDIEDSSDM